MNKNFTITIALCLSLTLGFSQEVKYWEHFIEFENHFGLRFEGMELENGNPSVYINELNKGRDTEGNDKGIMCLKKWRLIPNEGERPQPLTYYCLDDTENNRIYRKLYKTWETIPKVSAQETVAKKMPAYVKSPLDNYRKISMYENVSIRSESVIWRASHRIEYVSSTGAMTYLGSDTVKLNVSFPNFNGKLISSGKSYFSNKTEDLILLNGIRQKENKFSDLSLYAIMVIDKDGKIKGSSTADLKYDRIAVNINEVFDYTSSTEGVLKGYAIIFADRPFTSKKRRNPHRSEVDVVFINLDGSLEYKHSFKLDSDPTKMATIDHAKAAMVNDKLYILGKAVIGRSGNLFVQAMDKSGLLGGSVITGEDFLEVAHSEGNAHTVEGRKKATGSLVEHSGIDLTINGSFILAGAVNMGEKGVILYGQTWRNVSNPMPGQTRPTPSAGHGDMIALNFSEDCKLKNAWFGNISRETKRMNKPNVITPYFVSDNQIVFVSRRELNGTIPNSFKNVVLKEDYNRFEDLNIPQIPVLVSVNLETNEVKNIEIEKENFLPFPINKYHWQNPNTKSIFIIGYGLSKKSNMEHPSLLLTEFTF